MFLQLLISGLTLGLVYAVVSLGFQVVARAVSYRIPALVAVVLTVLAVTAVSRRRCACASR